MVEGVAGLGWLEMIGRLGLGALLGAMLGIEREWDGQDAGFRAHLLVVLGATLFGLLSVGASLILWPAGLPPMCRSTFTRIAAYVAPGIGFIGGGAILKYGGRVVGMDEQESEVAAAPSLDDCPPDDGPIRPAPPRRHCASVVCRSPQVVSASTASTRAVSR